MNRKDLKPGMLVKSAKADSIAFAEVNSFTLEVLDNFIVVENETVLVYIEPCKLMSTSEHMMGKKMC